VGKKKAEPAGLRAGRHSANSGRKPSNAKEIINGGGGKGASSSEGAPSLKACAKGERVQEKIQGEELFHQPRPFGQEEDR